MGRPGTAVPGVVIDFASIRSRSRFALWKRRHKKIETEGAKFAKVAEGWQ